MKTVFIGLLLAVLPGCAAWLQSTPSNVDPIDQKYIEAETGLKNAYWTLGELADKELAARAEGKPVGSVVDKDDYMASLERLDAAKRILRDGRAISGTACLDAATYKALGISGCLNRQQVALAVLAILTRINKETP